MIHEEFSAPCVRPSTENRDDTAEAYYSGLGRLHSHAYMGGLVFVGYVDEHGEEREAFYACRRSADSSRGQ